MCGCQTARSIACETTTCTCNFISLAQCGPCNIPCQPNLLTFRPKKYGERDPYSCQHDLWSLTNKRGRSQSRDALTIVVSHGNYILVHSNKHSVLYIPCGHGDPSTVGSRLSEPWLSVSEHLDVSSRRHVFGTSRKKTLRSLEFCYSRKQSCCTNDFPECYNAFFHAVQDLDHDLQHPSLLSKAMNAVVHCITAWQIKRRGK